MAIRKTLLAVVGAFALAVSAFTPAGAVLGKYDRPEASLNVAASRWNPGSQITYLGGAFQPGEQVVINFAGQITNVTTGGDGTFNQTTTVPWIAPSTHKITAVGQTTQRLAEFVFPIQAFNPWGAPSSYWFPVGTNLKFSGHRFANGETVDVYLDGKVVSTAVADFEGEFTNQGSYIVPPSDFGRTLHFTLKGRKSGATAPFTASVANWPLLNNGGSGTPPTKPEKPNEPVVEPTLQTSALASSLPGQTLWHSINWKGGSYDVCEFTVKASGGGAKYSYPFDNKYTAPYVDFSIAKKADDFVAIKVTAPDKKGSIDVNLHVTYKACAGATSTKTINTKVTLPITDDVPVFQKTTDAGDITQNTSKWVSVNWLGNAGNLTDFKVVVTNSQGSEIVYPSDRTFTSLQGDDVLGFGELDFTAININTTGLAKGVYILQLKTTAGPHVLSPTLSFSVV